jgi:hypothetical protein
MGKLKDSIMDDILDRGARMLAEEIDREMIESIQAEHLLANGWKESPITGPKHSFASNGAWPAETAEWCHLHCTGDYKYVLSHWWFEHPADATAFTLRFA